MNLDKISVYVFSVHSGFRCHFKKESPSPESSSFF